MQQPQKQPFQQPSKAPPVPPTKEGGEGQPLQRQNTKTAAPSPPRVIRDIYRTVAFTRIGFLGEVNLARTTYAWLHG